jgi:hypothetical protein
MPPLFLATSVIRYYALLPFCWSLPQLRPIVPGYVGTRSVKWLKRLTLEALLLVESQSAWKKMESRSCHHHMLSLCQQSLCTIWENFSNDNKLPQTFPKRGSL